MFLRLVAESFDRDFKIRRDKSTVGVLPTDEQLACEPEPDVRVDVMELAIEVLVSEERVRKCFGDSLKLRMAVAKAGPCVTDSDNFIWDLEFANENMRAIARLLLDRDEKILACVTRFGVMIPHSEERMHSVCACSRRGVLFTAWVLLRSPALMVSNDHHGHDGSDGDHYICVVVDVFPPLANDRLEYFIQRS
uniref:Uncharacterized protein n=1 Tax=Glossina morsitans morsitans TaxID=37546 RepID=A0A1B0FJX7_GLOMM